MLGGVTGDLGSGKTLLLAMLAEEYKKKKIYSNFTIRLPNVQIIDISDLEGLKQGLLLIDEAYVWLESRTSISAVNRYISRLIFQSRKREFDVFISSQLQSAIDLRYRHLQDLSIWALGLTPDEGAFEYVMEGWGKVKNFFLPYEEAKKLFPIFDTLEYPETTPTQFEPKRYNKEINRIIKLIEKEITKPEKMSLKMVNDFLIERGYDYTLTDSVHARIKRKILMK